MTTREAARPLRRYMRARVRAASLPPTYTITRDVTQAPASAQPEMLAPPIAENVRPNPVRPPQAGRYGQHPPHSQIERRMLGRMGVVKLWPLREVTSLVMV